MLCYLHTYFAGHVGSKKKKKKKGELYENPEWKLSSGFGVSSPSLQNKVWSGSGRSWWQTLLHGVKAKGQEAGSLLYLALSGWDCRPDLASVYKGPYWYISRSTPKGPASPNGSSVVPLGAKKPDSFSVGPCNSFLFTHRHSFHSCSWWKTSKMVFPAEGRWTRRCLVLVQGCSQECFFLLVSLLVDTKEGTFLFACCLRKYSSRWLVAHCSKFTVWDTSFECCQVRSEARNLMGGYLIFALLCAFSLQR